MEVYDFPGNMLQFGASIIGQPMFDFTDTAIDGTGTPLPDNTQAFGDFMEIPDPGDIIVGSGS